VCGALGSNVAFIAYGLALGLTPVWLLHAVLLPVNASRLTEALRSRHSLNDSRVLKPEGRNIVISKGFR
jgi:hypothetical protein